MKVVILGAGRVGFNLARQLIAEQKEVTIIEQDPDRARDLSHQLDCIVVNDSGNSFEGLDKAGAAEADFFISVTESDEINMIACALVASSFQRPVTIARVRNLDYSRTWNASPGFLGIDHIINPEIEAAQAIVRAVEHGAISSVVEFETSTLQLRNFQVEEGSVLCGKKVETLRKLVEVPFIVAALSHQDEMIIPHGATNLDEGDLIWILADSKDFPKLLAAIEESLTPIRSIVIVGGGNIGRYVAQYLIENQTSRKRISAAPGQRSLKSVKRTIHIIESDYSRCKELAELLPSAEITHADISEEQVLEEGRFSHFDLLITTTGNPELNIVTAAYARKAGIDRSIVLVKKYSTASMALSLGIDVAVSINQTLVNSIQKIIRSKHLRSSYKFSDSDLEMVEMPLTTLSEELAGKKIRDARLPGKPLILMVLRGDRHIIPTGDLQLEQDDILMLVTRKSSQLESS